MLTKQLSNVISAVLADAAVPLAVGEIAERVTGHPNWEMQSWIVPVSVIERRLFETPELYVQGFDCRWELAAPAQPFISDTGETLNQESKGSAAPREPEQSIADEVIILLKEASTALSATQLAVPIGDSRCAVTLEDLTVIRQEVERVLGDELAHLVEQNNTGAWHLQVREPATAAESWVGESNTAPSFPESSRCSELVSSLSDENREEESSQIAVAAKMQAPTASGRLGWMVEASRAIDTARLVISAIATLRDPVSALELAELLSEAGATVSEEDVLTCLRKTLSSLVEQTSNGRWAPMSPQRVSTPNQLDLLERLSPSVRVVEVSRDTPALFDWTAASGDIELALNRNHLGYRFFVSEHPVCVLMLAAWALMESGLPEASQRRASDLRQDWGRVMRDVARLAQPET